MRPVEVLHRGTWTPATLFDTRRDADGWKGLVAFSDPVTREGYYHWYPERDLREAPAPNET